MLLSVLSICNKPVCDCVIAAGRFGVSWNIELFCDYSKRKQMSYSISLHGGHTAGREVMMRSHIM